MGEMQDKSDAHLLHDYVERGVDAALREIVVRHTDLVYSAALRQVNSPDLARDIAQSVFISNSQFKYRIGQQFFQLVFDVGHTYEL